MFVNKTGLEDLSLKESVFKDTNRVDPQAPVPEGLDLTPRELRAEELKYLLAIRKYRLLEATGEGLIGLMRKQQVEVKRSMPSYFAWGEVSQKVVEWFNNGKLFEEMGFLLMAIVIVCEDKYEKATGFNMEFFNLDQELDSTNLEDILKRALKEKMGGLEENSKVELIIKSEFKKIGQSIQETRAISEKILNGEVPEIEIEDYLLVSGPNMAIRFLFFLNLLTSGIKIPDALVEKYYEIAGEVETLSRLANDLATLVRETCEMSEGDFSNSIIVDAVKRGELTKEEIIALRNSLGENKKMIQRASKRAFRLLFFGEKPNKDDTEAEMKEVERFFTYLRPSVNRGFKRWEEVFEKLKGELMTMGEANIDAGEMLRTQVRFLWQHIYFNNRLIEHAE